MAFNAASSSSNSHHHHHHHHHHNNSHQAHHNHHYHNHYYNQSHHQNNNYNTNNYTNTTNINSTIINTTTKNSQYSHKPIAHYKFHNDCQSSVLTFEQVKRLDYVMDQYVPIHGRGNFPTLFIKLKEFIRLVRHKLQSEHSIEIKNVRLNGGVATYILAPENSHYNDLDLILDTDLSNEAHFDVIRDVVLQCLKEFYPKQFYNNTNNQKPNNDINNSNTSSTSDHRETTTTNKQPRQQSQSLPTQQAPPFHEDRSFCAMKEAYVHKMVKVNDDDRWSLISLGVQRSEMNYCNCYRCTNQQQQLYQQHNMHSFNTNSPCGMKNNSYAHNVMRPRGFTSNASGNGNSNLAFGRDAFSTKLPGSCTDIDQNKLSSNYEPANRYSTTTTTTSSPISPSSSPVSTNDECTQNYHHFQPKHQYDFQQQHHNPYYLSTQQQLSHEKHQPPISIELKFVDRMRRKFEFSVDSFQIILDSLLQFYDCVPTSTISTMQSHAKNGHHFAPSMAGFMLEGTRCFDASLSPAATVQQTQTTKTTHKRSQQILNSNLTKSPIEVSIASSARAKAITTDTSKLSSSKLEMLPVLRDSSDCNDQQQLHQHRRCSDSVKTFSQDELSLARGKTCSSQIFYQLPYNRQIVSPSRSSVASSSGCSSSSSVVSSSSFSCDEDHDDLDGYVESSEAFTSSSVLSSSVATSTSSLQMSLKECQQSSQKQSSPSQIGQELQQEDESSIADSATSDTNKTQNNDVNDDDDGRTDDEEVVNEDHSAQEELQIDSISTNAPSITKNNKIEEDAEANTGQKVDRYMNNSTCSNGNGFLVAWMTSSCGVISKNFYPTVIAHSEYGNFKEALYHLENKLIATRNPEEIRGGGLLKYCNLLVKGYHPVDVSEIRTFERYMCSRFFIDFSDLNQQQAKLESYLANHFSDNTRHKFNYLNILHDVVQRSTVCLMNHELRLTLTMIKGLSYKLKDML